MKRYKLKVDINIIGRSFVTVFAENEESALKQAELVYGEDGIEIIDGEIEDIEILEVVDEEGQIQS